jgi:hypothetical protein
MILTNAQSVNEGKIDIDPADISEILENDGVSGGCIIVMTNGNTYIVTEDFDTVERLRHDATN